MTVVRDGWADLTIGASVFIRGLGVVGVAETGVPGIEAGDLVADETGVVPAWSPVDGLAHGGRHDNAAMVGHVRAGSLRRAGKGVEPARPVYSKHGGLVLCIQG